MTHPFTAADSFDVPRKLYSDSPYHVVRRDTPKLLWLRDYNGDGAKAEFALFDAESCSDLFTALLGYSRRQDRLIWYHVRVSDLERIGDTEWPETLFATKRARDGVCDTHWGGRAMRPYDDVKGATIRLTKQFDAVCRGEPKRNRRSSAAWRVLEWCTPYIAWPPNPACSRRRPVRILSRG